MDRYPLEALPPRDIEWTPSAAAITGGASLSGLTQLGRTDGGGFWIARYNRCPVGNDAQIAAHDALEARLDGGASPLIVPRPRVIDPALTAAFSDGAPFDDGALFTAPSVIASFAASAALRATTIDVLLSAGDFYPDFTIDHAEMGPRYYRIARRTDLGGGVWRLEIRTPLREPCSLGQALDFDDPRCLMRLADPKSMDLELTYGRWGVFSPIFVEHFE